MKSDSLRKHPLITGTLLLTLTGILKIRIRIQVLESLVKQTAPTKMTAIINYLLQTIQLTVLVAVSLLTVL